PLRGWWEGRDIELKRDTGLYPDAATWREQLERRDRDRQRLVEALRVHGFALPAGFDADSGYDSALSIAVHGFLAATRAGLAVLQLEDMMEERDLVNLPGSTE